MDKKVLIVEDEPDIREAMAEAVAEAGFEVHTATNGEEGLKSAIELEPDLVLLDIVMPIMDGHKMLESLRGHPKGADVKVIMLTSMDDVRNISEAHGGTITDYIIKAHSSLEDIVAKVKLEIYSD